MLEIDGNRPVWKVPAIEREVRIPVGGRDVVWIQHIRTTDSWS